MVSETTVSTGKGMLHALGMLVLPTVSAHYSVCHQSLETLEVAFSSSKSWLVLPPTSFIIKLWDVK